MKPCPTSEMLAAYLHDDLDALRCEEIELHSEQCSTCQAELAGLVVATSPIPSGPDRRQARVDTPSHFRPNADTPERLAIGVPSIEADHIKTELPMIPGFEVVRIVGRGGMGVVYEARELDLNRRVALKMLHLDAGDAESLARFQREAETVATLNHPNIVRIFGVGKVDGRPYLALELVTDGNLADLLHQGPMAPDAAAAILEQVARGVHCAHEAGVIHRDLKPANILLQKDAGGSFNGSPSSFIPKVADFGLARKVDAAQRLTQTGMLMGTPQYMAPEQTKEKDTHVGPATDLHALGAILYEMLTGRPPFLGASTIETMLTLVNTEAVPPRRLNPSVPRDLDTICLKCLEKDPARRYASAAALADDLSRFQRGEPILARPTSSIERLAKWARRHPIVAGLLAVVVLLTLGGGGLVTGLWLTAANALNETENERKNTAKALDETENERKNTARALVEAKSANTLAKRALDETERERRKTERALAENLLLLAEYEYSQNKLDLAREHLDAIPKHYRDTGWDRMVRHINAPRGAFGTDGLVLFVTFSADGRYLAALRGGKSNREVMVWEHEKNRLVLRRAIDADTVGLYFPAKGEEIGTVAMNTQPTTRLLETIVKTYKFNGAPSGSRTFTGRIGNAAIVFPDARMGLTAPFLGKTLRQVSLMYFDTGEMRTFPMDDLMGRFFFLNKDGRKLAATGFDRTKTTFRVVDLEHFKVERELATTADVFLDFSADFRTYCTTTTNHKDRIFHLSVFDAETGKLKWQKEYSVWIAGAAISPNCEWIAVGTQDQRVHVVSLKTGEDLLTLYGLQHHPANLRFSPDSRFLAVSASQLHTWAIAENIK